MKRADVNIQLRTGDSGGGRSRNPLLAVASQCIMYVDKFGVGSAHRIFAWFLNKVLSVFGVSIYYWSSNNQFTPFVGHKYIIQLPTDLLEEESTIITERLLGKIDVLFGLIPIVFWWIAFTTYPSFVSTVETHIQYSGISILIGVGLFAVATAASLSFLRLLSVKVTIQKA